MSAQSPFILPLRGLGQGVYAYDLIADDAFFATFPDSPVTRAHIEATLVADRRTREMTLDFSFAGTVATTCDRCLAPIDLPIAGKEQIIVKFRADAANIDDDEEVIFLDPETSLFNFAPYAYELILLAVPMVSTYDCQAGKPPYPCDEEMLRRIDASVQNSSDQTTQGDDDEDESGSSPWDVLKNLQ